jgi:hypothetical protein
MKELVRIVLEGDNKCEKIGFFSLLSKKLSCVGGYFRSGLDLGIYRYFSSKTENAYCNSFQCAI